MLSSTFIDEVGYVPLADVGAELLFQVIAERAERATVIITTNLLLSEWTQVFLHTLRDCCVATLLGGHFVCLCRNSRSLLAPGNSPFALTNDDSGEKCSAETQNIDSCFPFGEKL